MKINSVCWNNIQVENNHDTVSGQYRVQWEEEMAAARGWAQQTAIQAEVTAIRQTLAKMWLLSLHGECKNLKRSYQPIDGSVPAPGIRNTKTGRGFEASRRQLGNHGSGNDRWHLKGGDMAVTWWHGDNDGCLGSVLRLVNISLCTGSMERFTCDPWVTNNPCTNFRKVVQRNSNWSAARPAKPLVSFILKISLVRLTVRKALLHKVQIVRK